MTLRLVHSRPELPFLRMVKRADRDAACMIERGTDSQTELAVRYTGQRGKPCKTPLTLVEPDGVA